MKSPLNPLNPAAGDVPVPEDQREIDAALRAGRISHRAFPYIAWRYRERGRKFTQSDSAWLAWLTRFDKDRVGQQITWLRNVLSNRGMPSWILQTHLTVLHRQLTRTIPENEQNYRSLAISAVQLRRDREEQIPPEQVQRLSAEFVGAFGQKSSLLLFGTGQLITAAVADEKLGVKNAVSSLLEWMVDVPRFVEIADIGKHLAKSERRLLDSESIEQRWKDAIAKTVENARGN